MRWRSQSVNESKNKLGVYVHTATISIMGNYIPAIIMIIVLMTKATHWERENYKEERNKSVKEESEFKTHICPMAPKKAKDLIFITEMMAGVEQR